MQGRDAYAGPPLHWLTQKSHIISRLDRSRLIAEFIISKVRRLTVLAVRIENTTASVCSLTPIAGQGPWSREPGNTYKLK